MNSDRHQIKPKPLVYPEGNRKLNTRVLIFVYFVVRPLIFAFLLFFVGMAWSFLFWASIWIAMSLTPYIPRLGHTMLGTLYNRLVEEQFGRFRYNNTYKTSIIVIDSIHVMFAIFLFVFANIRLIDYIH